MALSVSIELVSSSARVTSVNSTQGVGLTHSLSDGHPDTKIGPGIPGSDKNIFRAIDVVMGGGQSFAANAVSS